MTAANGIRSAIREGRRIIEEVQKMDGNEAETRRRVERLFETIMGYDAFRHLSREYAVHGVGDTEHMDFAVKVTPERVAMIVELKRVCMDLAPKHLKQAMRYAVDLGCEWVLLTNARQWELYHLEFGQPPETRLIKGWNLLQDDLAALEESFGLVSLGNLRKDGLGQLWETQSALTAECLLREILAEDSLRALKNAIRRRTGVGVNPEDLVGAIRRLLNDSAGALMDQMRISLPERKPRRPRSGKDDASVVPISEVAETQAAAGESGPA